MGSLELQQETTPMGAAVTARFRVSHLAARVSALVVLLLLTVALGAAVRSPLDLGASSILGFLIAVLLSRFWLERFSVQAIVDNDRISISRRAGTRLRTEQLIPRVHDGQFIVADPPRFLGMNVSDRRNLNFGEHVVQLPLVLASPGRATQICAAWNQLLAEQPTFSA